MGKKKGDCRGYRKKGKRKETRKEGCKALPAREKKKKKAGPRFERKEREEIWGG